MIRNRTSSARVIPPYINSLQSYDTIGGDEEGYLFFDEDGLPSIQTPEGGGGAVDSVNSQTGVVVLDHEDVGADEAGAAAAALATANGYTDDEVAAEAVLRASGDSANATAISDEESARIAADSLLVAGPALSVDSEIVLYSGTSGKLVKRAAISGLAKLASGVLSAASVGSDYYAPGSTDVAVADGGTGASTEEGARENLGLGTSATRDVGTTTGTVAAGDDSRFTDARPPTGAAGGQLGGSYPNPDVRGLRETSGPTSLTYGDIADGQLLKRVGSTIIGTFIMLAVATVMPPELAIGVNSTGATVGSLV